MGGPSILVVDDQQVVCHGCQRVLSDEGFSVDVCQDPNEGLSRLQQAIYDLVLVDLKMPELDGMEFLRRARAEHPDLEFIMMTGFAEIATAVEAIKLGAFDYLPKPFSPDQLLVAVSKALESHQLQRENRYLREQLQSRYVFGNMVGNCDAMRQAYALVARVAPTNATVIIRGESGTGKELIARAIHFNSNRKDRPFVAVDCGALHENLLESELFGHVPGAFTGAVGAKKGFFEAAEGGTLFLDEIGNTSLALQTRLLRVLQERVYTPVGDTAERSTNVRLIAATHADLEQMVTDGRFREDLFYRLNIVAVQVPPLRERREDIPDLVRHFVQKFCREVERAEMQTAPQTMQMLTEYAWPGNVRELENVIHRAVILAGDSGTSPSSVFGEELKSALRGTIVRVVCSRGLVTVGWRA